MKVARISAAGGGCCECNEVSGCTCTGANCGLECRTQTSDLLALPSLCGFDPFIADTAQPRKYRRKKITGTLYICTFTNANCVAPAYPRNYYGAGSEYVGGFPYGPVVTEGSVTVIGETPTLLRYKVKVSASYGGDPTVYGRMQVGGAFYDDGATLTISKAFGFPAYCKPCAKIGAFTEGGSSVAGFIGNEASGSYRDRWDIVGDYDAATCGGPSVANNFARFTTMTCGATSGGAPDTSPVATIGGPAGARNGSPGGPALYPPSLYRLTVTPTTRTTEGDGCKNNPVSGSQTMTGNVSEQLTNEDTEADAIARARDQYGNPLVWSGAAPCTDSTTAFITPRSAGVYQFAFRSAQTRIKLNSVLPGRTYAVTVRFFRRAVGSGLPFKFYAKSEFSITTANPLPTGVGVDQYLGTWLDVPNEGGWETKPGNCSAILQP